MRLYQFILWVLVMVSAFGQELDNRLESLDSDIENLMKAYHTVGLSICVVENNQTLYRRGFGFRNLKEKLAVNESTVFPIGSVTKPFTAALIGIFEGKKKLSLADRPIEHIDYLRFYNDQMNNLVTIEDLLAHKSGMGVVDGTHVFFPTQNSERHLKRLPHLKPNSQVREKFDYSNMGYAILGGVVEEISGKTWNQNVTELLFEPLEMKDSSTDLKSFQELYNHATGYGVLKNGDVIPVRYEDQFESAASGAINSSIYDMSNWMNMLFNKGKFKGRQIISQEYLEHSFSKQTIITESFRFNRKFVLLNDAYGYGWFTHNYKGLFRVNHEGNVSGFTSSINLYPHKNVGIAILCNQSSSNHLHKTIVDMITNKLFGLPEKKWNNYTVQFGNALVANKSPYKWNTDKKLSKPLTEFTGKYSNHGYGALEIILQNDHLEIIFPSMILGLAHKHCDSFETKIIDETHQNVPTFQIDFCKNNKGEVSELKIDFQIEPVVFGKIP